MAEKPSLLVAIGGIVAAISLAAYAAMRPLGWSGLMMPVAACLAVVVAKKRMIFFRSLFPFYIFSLLVLVLSLFSLMPRAWTIYHSNFAALRHWAWLPIFTLYATAFYYYAREHWDFVARNSLALAAVSFVISRAVELVMLPSISVQRDILLYGITDENALTFAFLTIYICYTARTRLRALICGVVLVLLCSAATSVLAALMVIAMRMIRFRKQACLGLFCAFGLFTLFAPIWTYQLYQVDVNTGVRLVFWGDAQTAIWETHGIGVGYGTEYIRNDLRILDNRDAQELIEEDAQDRLFVGTHNSLYDIALRTGVIGFALFLIGFLKEIRGIREKSRYAPLYYGFLSAFIVNNSLNMGLASVNLMLGSALFCAIIVIAKNRSLAETQTGRRVRF